jgi:hypothetical protein
VPAQWQECNRLLPGRIDLRQGMSRMETKQQILPEQKQPTYFRSYKWIGLLIVAWVAIAWLSADYYYSHLADNL